MKQSQVEGCNYCLDPVAVTLQEKEIKRLSNNISVYRCPKCGCLILDDIYGWKGSGIVFRATEEMIDEYMKEQCDR